jgi:hypothetical protein
MDNSSHRDVSGKILMLFLILLVVGGVVAASVILFVLPVVYPHGAADKLLRADGSYFVKGEQNEDYAAFVALLYITNPAESISGNVRITTYVIDSAENIVLDEIETGFGPINEKQTIETDIRFNIPLYNQSKQYTINFLIFEDNMIVLKGTGTIGIHYYYHNGSYYTDSSVSGITFHAE